MPTATPSRHRTTIRDRRRPIVAKQVEPELSPIARRLLWHVYSVGTVRIIEPDHHEPFEKPGAHLFWVKSGRGRLETAAGDYVMRPGRYAWFIDMTQPRTYIPNPRGHVMIQGLRIGGPGLDAWHEVLGCNRHVEFNLDEISPLIRCHDEVMRLAKREAPGWEWQVHLKITEVLGKLLFTRDRLNPKCDRTPTPIARVLDAVSTDPDRDWKAQELAPVAGVSYSGLRALFQRTQQEGLHTFIQRIRLDRARLLLGDLSLSIKEVSTRLDFSSEFYFSQFFRKNTGMTPTQFRHQQHPRQSRPTEAHPRST